MSRGIRQEDDASQYWDLVRRIERLEAPQEPISPIAFNTTNWTNYATSVPDATQALCGSWIDKSGNVHVQGLARRVNTAWVGGSASATIGAVVAAHAPVKVKGGTCWYVDGGGNQTAMRMSIATSGNITMIAGVAGVSLGGGVGSIIYLDGLFWRLDA